MSTTRTAADYVHAFAHGQFPDGTPLERATPPEGAQQPTDEVTQEQKSSSAEKPSEKQVPKEGAATPAPETRKLAPKDPAKTEPKSSSASATVSDKVTRFILSFIASSPGEMSRTVDIGRAALGDASIVRTAIAAPEDSRCTAWAGTPCKKLIGRGLLKQELVHNDRKGEGRGNARNFLVFYKVNAAGKKWLADHPVEK